MPRFRRSRAVAALLVAVPGIAAAQSRTVTGVVRDPADGLPVQGARVALAAWLGGYSDRAGAFTIAVPPGRFVPRVSCPRAGENDLVMELAPVTVTDSSTSIAIPFEGGRRCLPALEEVGHGEFAGILRGGEVRWLELCDGPSYRIAVELPVEMARELARRFSRATDSRKNTLTVTVRGHLEGPGFFGNDGSGHYLLTVETIRSARLATAGTACPR